MFRESQQLVQEEFAAETQREREAQQRVIKKQVHRHLDMCQNTIARMMHIQVALAFDAFYERIEDKKSRTAT